MPLVPGVRMGPCEVRAQIGAGGMGEVYRALDTRLGREVAIKILPEAFASDPERLARFEREARTLASLNHPNIAQIHGLETSDAIRALVMEFVEGPTLADRIARGPIPPDEALPIATQIADALAAAHEQGIVHRDLKPANIKLRPDGVVKVLDFGLAKALEPVSAIGVDATASPTITSPAATRLGTILGTAAYMSPEQARGRIVDKRTDIWAFGVVFYEMLAGTRPFDGEDVTETIAAVVKEQPDLQRAPVGMRRLLDACLQKDPKKRLQAIGDAWLLLEDSGTPEAVAPERSRQSAFAWGVAAVALLLAAGVSVVHFREQSPIVESVRFQIPAPVGVSMSGGAPPTVSPDGRSIVFVAEGVDSPRGLWLHSLDSLQSRRLQGTDGATGPFWSPDSRMVRFFAAGKLLKVDAAGGPVQTVAVLPAQRNSVVSGGGWSPDGRIIFPDHDLGLSTVDDGGGVPVRLTVLDRARGEVLHSSPVFLPDGVHFLYRRASNIAENSGIYIGSLDAAPAQHGLTRLLAADAGALYVATSDPAGGHVLFVRERALMAQPFDYRRLELSGPAVPLTQAGEAGAAFFSVSRTGVLAYRPNRTGGDSQLTWFTRDGKVLNRALVPGLVDIALSPDGERVAGSSSDLSLAGFAARRFESGTPAAGDGDLWVGEFERGTRIRLTSNAAEDGLPVWSPDATRIVFASNRDGVFDLYYKSTRVAGDEALLFKSGENKLPNHWSPDGRWLLYSSNHPKTGDDLWVLPLSGSLPSSEQPLSYISTDFHERGGRFSPDGHWIAYVSNATGQNEIYVQAFPAPAGAIVVSAGGGREPRWRHDGRELFYVGPRGEVMVVAVTTRPTFRVTGAPRRLFDAPIYGGPATINSFDVAGDGQRFLIKTSPEATADPGSVTVILNWTEELKRLVPTN